MVGNIFRAAALGAALLISAVTTGFAQDQNADSLPPAIVAQLNQAAANQSPADYAKTVADIVAANPGLAASIAGTATQIRPAAAVILAQTIAPVITDPTIAGSVLSSIVAALPAADKGTVGANVVNTYSANAPPVVANSPVFASVEGQQLATLALPAAGGQDQNGKNDTKIPGQKDIANTDNNSSHS
jgi:hypothetical protein